MRVQTRRLSMIPSSVLLCLSWSLGLSVATTFTAVQAGEDIEISDIVAVARQNARLPQTVRITWSIEKGPTDAAKHYNEQLAQQMTAAIEANAVPTDQVDRIHQRIAGLKRQVEFAKREFAEFDYWTDFESFQHRAIRHVASGAPFGFSEPLQIDFPDQLPNHTDVAKLFADISILSYGPATDRAFRLWQASDREPHLGRVALESPWHMEWHPPLIMATADWGGTTNPVDDFFSMLESFGGTVLGEVEYLGISHLLVFTTDGKRSMRAFVDFERGAVPSRIEEFLWKLSPEELLCRTISDESSKLTAQFVTTCEINSTKCANGVYYFPESGQTRMIARAASVDDAISAAQPELAVYRLTTWKFKRVECDRTMKEEDFRLAFPPGMIYVDELAKATFTTGDLEGNMQRVADGAINFGKRPIHRGWIYGGVAFVIAGGGIGFALFRKRKRRIA